MRGNPSKKEDMPMRIQPDTSFNEFAAVFAQTGAKFALITPTANGMKKSIMDATAPVRELLLDAGVHDYETQLQGPANKKLVPTHFVTAAGLIDSTASLYRPVTKQGDPRIWFKGLPHYCEPLNLLALIVIEKEIYVLNLSDQGVASSLKNQDYAYTVLMDSTASKRALATELLAKLRKVHAAGFLPSITTGDPGVGDTLENALGISRNNNKAPDYKGIELKATRLTRSGKKRSATRQTLFTKTPEEGMRYAEIVVTYGKMQIPKGRTEPRLQLYETVRCSRANAYDLVLEYDSTANKLIMLHEERAGTKCQRNYVSGWNIKTLQQALLVKHHETFWVKAQSKTIGGLEYFRYDEVLHTKNPNVSLVGPLLAQDVITVDLAAHMEGKRCRDHGVLFKMWPDDLPLIMGKPEAYVL